MTSQKNKTYMATVSFVDGDGKPREKLVFRNDEKSLIDAVNLTKKHIVEFGGTYVGHFIEEVLGSPEGFEENGPASKYH